MLTDLYSYLTLNGITAYPDKIPEGTDISNPVVVFSLQSEDCLRSLSGVKLGGHTDIKCEIGCYDHASTDSTGTALRALLDNYRGNLGSTYVIVSLDDETEDTLTTDDGSDREVFIREQTYKFRW